MSVKAWRIAFEYLYGDEDWTPKTEYRDTLFEADLLVGALKRHQPNETRNYSIIELCPVEEREKAFDEGMDKYHDLCCLVLDYFSEPTDINKRRLIDGAYDKWEQK